MEKIKLQFIGYDDWSRPTFESEDGKLFVDLNLGEGKVDLCTVVGNVFNGEPNRSIRHIEKYKNVEFEINGMEEEPTREEKFNYQMLDRLRSDCEYYLGNGNRHTKFLWAGSEKDQINEMKRLYNYFSEDKKPEWLTWEDILKYESKMVEK